MGSTVTCGISCPERRTPDRKSSPGTGEPAVAVVSVRPSSWAIPLPDHGQFVQPVGQRVVFEREFVVGNRQPQRRDATQQRRQHDL